MTDNLTTIITGQENIETARMMAIRAALRLEIKGLKRRGTSAFALAKRIVGSGGSKEQVLLKLCHEIDRRLSQ